MRPKFSFFLPCKSLSCFKTGCGFYRYILVISTESTTLFSVGTIVSSQYTRVRGFILQTVDQFTLISDVSLTYLLTLRVPTPPPPPRTDQGWTGPGPRSISFGLENDFNPVTSHFPHSPHKDLGYSYGSRGAPEKGINEGLEKPVLVKVEGGTWIFLGPVDLWDLLQSTNRPG